jgi:glycosyltransferase involved in cell wall biosynthesis
LIRRKRHGSSRDDDAAVKLLVLTDYFVPHSGGIERSTYEVSRRIASMGHDVTVLTLGRVEADTEIDGLHVVRVPGWDIAGLTGAQTKLSLHVWPAVRRLIRERKIELMHVHGLFFQTALAGAIVGRLCGVPVVTTAHIGSIDSVGGLYGRLASIYEQTAGRMLLQSSHQVIAVSQDVAHHVAGLGVAPNKLTVVYNGVDFARYADARRCVGVSRPPRLVFVGRLTRNKGPDVFLDALREVMNRFPDAECWFVGDGPLRPELKRRARQYGLSAKVRFLGERDDVPELLAQCDVFVRPSFTEGMPLAVLEAMAAGLPVVATRVGGTAEVVLHGQTGFIVAPGDAEALGACLQKLLGDRELREHMGELGRKAAPAYDWDRTTQKTLAVYEKALGLEVAVG